MVVAGVAGVLKRKDGSTMFETNETLKKIHQTINAAAVVFIFLYSSRP
jgi:hypothetical protein